MNDLRLQQTAVNQQQQTQRNSNYSTATIVKKRHTGGSFSLSRPPMHDTNNEHSNSHEYSSHHVNTNNNNNNRNEFIEPNHEQENHYEPQYPEDMLDVQVIAKMQEESLRLSMMNINKSKHFSRIAVLFNL